MIYIDSSALIKLVIAEPESSAMAQFADGQDLCSSALIRTETLRAVARLNPRRVAMASALLERVETMAITASVLSEAAALHPPELRTLDAIHLASALRFGQSIGVLVSYDVRMVAAGGQLGLLVASPGA